MPRPLFRLRNPLRVIACFLVVCLMAEQAAWAAPEASRLSLNLPKARYALPVPASIATLDEAWLGGHSTIYLLQDAHTNPSAQLNLSQTLESLFRMEPDLDLVFVEGGFGNNTLWPLRRYKEDAERRRLASAELRKGLLHGEEFLNLTGDKPFTIWGVEDRALYEKAIASFRRTQERRPELQAILDRTRLTQDHLRGRVLNPVLASFDRRRLAYEKGDLPLTEYLEDLRTHARTLSAHSAYPELEKLWALKKSEEKLDFEEARAEQAKAIAALGADQKREIQALGHNPSKLKSSDARDGEEAYWAKLSESVSAGAYPALSAYLKYRAHARALNLPEVLKEIGIFETELLKKLALSEDETSFIDAEKLSAFQIKLFTFTLTREEFESYEDLSRRVPAKKMIGFLNRLLLEEGKAPERALFLENEFEALKGEAEAFYRLTRDRDKAFIDQALAKLKETGRKKAALIAGGYHAAHLKELLKSRGVSYVSIVPQVREETNLKRYEQILLSSATPAPTPNLKSVGRLARPLSLASSPRFSSPSNVFVSAARLAEVQTALMRAPAFTYEPEFKADLARYEAALAAIQTYPVSEAGGARLAGYETFQNFYEYHLAGESLSSSPGWIVKRLQDTPHDIRIGKHRAGDWEVFFDPETRLAWAPASAQIEWITPFYRGGPVRGFSSDPFADIRIKKGRGFIFKGLDTVLLVLKDDDYDRLAASVTPEFLTGKSRDGSFLWKIIPAREAKSLIPAGARLAVPQTPDELREILDHPEARLLHRAGEFKTDRLESSGLFVRDGFVYSVHFSIVSRAESPEPLKIPYFTIYVRKADPGEIESITEESLTPLIHKTEAVGTRVIFQQYSPGFKSLRLALNRRLEAQPVFHSAFEGYPKAGGFAWTDRKVDRRLETRRWPRRKTIGVLEREPGDSLPALGAAFAELRRRGNRIRFVTFKQGVPIAEQFGGVQPSILFPPLDTFNEDRSVDEAVRAYVRSRGGAVDLGYYESLHEDSRSPVNAYIPFTEEQLETALRAMGRHFTQLERTNYIAVVKELAAYAARRGIARGLLPAETKYASPVSLKTREKGTYRSMTTAEAADAIQKMSERMPVIILSPHADDDVIALPGLVFYAIGRFTGAGAYAVENWVFGDGEPGVKKVDSAEAERTFRFLRTQLDESKSDFFRNLRREQAAYQREFRRNAGRFPGEVIEAYNSWKDLRAIKSEIRNRKDEPMSPGLFKIIQKSVRYLEVTDAAEDLGASSRAKMRIEWLQLQAASFAHNSGSPSREMVRHDVEKLKDRLKLFFKRYQAEIKLDLAEGRVAIIAPPHVLDSHPHHVDSALVFDAALSEFEKENEAAASPLVLPNLVVADYLAPWAGGYNGYFLSDMPSARVKKLIRQSRRIPEDRKEELASRVDDLQPYGRGLAVLLGELGRRGGFGGNSPTPNEMFGKPVHRGPPFAGRLKIVPGSPLRAGARLSDGKFLTLAFSALAVSALAGFWSSSPAVMGLSILASALIALVAGWRAATSTPTFDWVEDDVDTQFFSKTPTGFFGSLQKNRREPNQEALGFEVRRITDNPSSPTFGIREDGSWELASDAPFRLAWNAQTSSIEWHIYGSRDPLSGFSEDPYRKIQLLRPRSLLSRTFLKPAVRLILSDEAYEAMREQVGGDVDTLIFPSRDGGVDLQITSESTNSSLKGSLWRRLVEAHRFSPEGARLSVFSRALWTVVMLWFQQAVIWPQGPQPPLGQPGRIFRAVDERLDSAKAQVFEDRIEIALDPAQIKIQPSFFLIRTDLQPEARAIFPALVLRTGESALTNTRMMGAAQLSLDGTLAVNVRRAGPYAKIIVYTDKALRRQVAPLEIEKASVVREGSESFVAFGMAPASHPDADKEGRFGAFLETNRAVRTGDLLRFRVPESDAALWSGQTLTAQLSSRAGGRPLMATGTVSSDGVLSIRAPSNFTWTGFYFVVSPQIRLTPVSILGVYARGYTAGARLASDETSELSPLRDSAEEASKLLEGAFKFDEAGHMNFAGDKPLIELTEADFDLYLERHGLTDANKEMRMQGAVDGPLNQLNDDGKDGAKTAAKNLLDHLRADLEAGADVVVATSQFGRSRETAQAFVDLVFEELGIQLELQVEGFLREMSFGEYDNLNEAEVAARGGAPSIERFRRGIDSQVHYPGNNEWGFPAESFGHYAAKVVTEFRGFKARMLRRKQESGGRKLIVTAFGHGLSSSALRAALGDRTLMDRSKTFINWRDNMMVNSAPAKFNPQTKDIEYLPAAAARLAGGLTRRAVLAGLAALPVAAQDAPVPAADLKFFENTPVGDSVNGIVETLSSVLSTDRTPARTTLRLSAEQLAKMKAADYPNGMLTVWLHPITMDRLTDIALRVIRADGTEVKIVFTRTGSAKKLTVDAVSGIKDAKIVEEAAVVKLLVPVKSLSAVKSFLIDTNAGAAVSFAQAFIAASGARLVSAKPVRIVPREFADAWRRYIADQGGNFYRSDGVDFFHSYYPGSTASPSWIRRLVADTLLTWRVQGLARMVMNGRPILFGLTDAGNQIDSEETSVSASSGSGSPVEAGARLAAPTATIQNLPAPSSLRLFFSRATMPVVYLFPFLAPIRSLAAWYWKSGINPFGVSRDVQKRFWDAAMQGYRAHRGPSLQTFVYKLPPDLSDVRKLELAAQNIGKMTKMFSPDFVAGRSILKAPLEGTPYYVGMIYGVTMSGGVSATHGVTLVVGREIDEWDPLNGAFFWISLDTLDAEEFPNALRINEVQGVVGAQNEIQEFRNRMGLHPGVALIHFARQLANRGHARLGDPTKNPFTILMGIRPAFLTDLLKGDPTLEIDGTYRSAGIRKRTSYAFWQTVEHLNNLAAKREKETGDEQSAKEAASIGLIHAAFSKLEEINMDFGARLAERGYRPVADEKTKGRIAAVILRILRRNNLTMELPRGLKDFRIEREGNDAVTVYVPYIANKGPIQYRADRENEERVSAALRMVARVLNARYPDYYFVQSSSTVHSQNQASGPSHTYYRISFRMLDRGAGARLAIEKLGILKRAYTGEEIYPLFLNLDREKANAAKRGETLKISLDISSESHGHTHADSGVVYERFDRGFGGKVAFEKRVKSYVLPGYPDDRIDQYIAGKLISVTPLTYTLTKNFPTELPKPRVRREPAGARLAVPVTIGWDSALNYLYVNDRQITPGRETLAENITAALGVPPQTAQVVAMDLEWYQRDRQFYMMRNSRLLTNSSMIKISDRADGAAWVDALTKAFEVYAESEYKKDNVFSVDAGVLRVGRVGEAAFSDPRFMTKIASLVYQHSQHMTSRIYNKTVVPNVAVTPSDDGVSVDLYYGGDAFEIENHMTAWYEIPKKLTLALQASGVFEVTQVDRTTSERAPASLATTPASSRYTASEIVVGVKKIPTITSEHLLSSHENLNLLAAYVLRNGLERDLADRGLPAFNGVFWAAGDLEKIKASDIRGILLPEGQDIRASLMRLFEMLSMSGVAMGRAIDVYQLPYTGKDDFEGTMLFLHLRPRNDLAPTPPAPPAVRRGGPDTGLIGGEGDLMPVGARLAVAQPGDIFLNTKHKYATIILANDRGNLSFVQVNKQGQVGRQESALNYNFWANEGAQTWERARFERFAHALAQSGIRSTYHVQHPEGDYFSVNFKMINTDRRLVERMHPVIERLTGALQKDPELMFKVTNTDGALAYEVFGGDSARKTLFSTALAYQLGLLDVPAESGRGARLSSSKDLVPVGKALAKVQPPTQQELMRRAFGLLIEYHPLIQIQHRLDPEFINGLQRQWLKDLGEAGTLPEMERIGREQDRQMSDYLRLIAAAFYGTNPDWQKPVLIEGRTVGPLLGADLRTSVESLEFLIDLRRQRNETLAQELQAIFGPRGAELARGSLERLQAAVSNRVQGPRNLRIVLGLPSTDVMVVEAARGELQALLGANYLGLLNNPPLQNAQEAIDVLVRAQLAFEQTRKHAAEGARLADSAASALEEAQNHLLLSRKNASGSLEEIRAWERSRNTPGPRRQTNQDLYLKLREIVEAPSESTTDAQREKAISHLEELSFVGDEETLGWLKGLLAQRQDFSERLRGIIAKAMLRLERNSIEARIGRIYDLQWTEAVPMNAALQEFAQAAGVRSAHIEIDSSKTSDVQSIDFAEYSLTENRYIIFRAIQQGADVHLYRMAVDKAIPVARDENYAEKIYPNSTLKVTDIRGNTAERVTTDEFLKVWKSGQAGASYSALNSGIFAHTHVTFQVVRDSGKVERELMGHIYDLSGKIALTVTELAGVRMLRLWDEIRPSEFSDKRTKYPADYVFRGFDPIKVVPFEETAPVINQALLDELSGRGLRSAERAHAPDGRMRVSAIGAFLGGAFPEGSIPNYREYLSRGVVTMKGRKVESLELQAIAGDEDGVLEARTLNASPETDIANVALGEWFVWGMPGNAIRFTRFEDFHGKQNMLDQLQSGARLAAQSGQVVLSVEDKIIAIVAEQVDKEAGEVNLDDELLSDHGLDSLDIVELMMAFEEAFDLDIPDELAEEALGSYESFSSAAAKMRNTATVRDVARFIKERISWVEAFNKSRNPSGVIRGNARQGARLAVFDDLSGVINHFERNVPAPHWDSPRAGIELVINGKQIKAFGATPWGTMHDAVDFFKQHTASNWPSYDVAKAGYDKERMLYVLEVSGGPGAEHTFKSDLKPQETLRFETFAGGLELLQYSLSEGKIALLWTGEGTTLAGLLKKTRIALRNGQIVDVEKNQPLAALSDSDAFLLYPSGMFLLFRAGADKGAPIEKFATTTFEALMGARLASSIQIAGVPFKRYLIDESLPWVLVTEALDPRALEYLVSSGRANVDIFDVGEDRRGKMTSAQLIEVGLQSKAEGRNYRGIVSFVNHQLLKSPEFLEAFPGLEINANFSRGFEHATKNAVPNSVVVTNIDDILTDAMAEINNGMMLEAHFDLQNTVRSEKAGGDSALDWLGLPNQALAQILWGESMRRHVLQLDDMYAYGPSDRFRGGSVADAVFHDQWATNEPAGIRRSLGISGSQDMVRELAKIAKAYNIHQVVYNSPDRLPREEEQALGLVYERKLENMQNLTRLIRAPGGASFGRTPNVVDSRELFARRSDVEKLSRSMEGMVVGIQSFGAISQATARRAIALGLRPRVLVRDLEKARREMPGDFAGKVDLFAVGDETSFFREVEIILPLANVNDESRNFIRKETLAMMPKLRVIINTGRGELVNEDDLADYLEAYPEVVARLDVVQNESAGFLGRRLAALANVKMSGHNGSAVTDIRYAMQMNALRDNLLNFLASRPVKNQVAGPISAARLASRGKAFTAANYPNVFAMHGAVAKLHLQSLRSYLPAGKAEYYISLWEHSLSREALSTRSDEAWTELQELARAVRESPIDPRFTVLVQAVITDGLLQRAAALKNHLALDAEWMTEHEAEYYELAARPTDTRDAEAGFQQIMALLGRGGARLSSKPLASLMLKVRSGEQEAGSPATFTDDLLRFLAAVGVSSVPFGANRQLPLEGPNRVVAVYSLARQKNSQTEKDVLVVEFENGKTEVLSLSTEDRSARHAETEEAELVFEEALTKDLKALQAANAFGSEFAATAAAEAVFLHVDSLMSHGKKGEISKFLISLRSNLSKNSVIVLQGKNAQAAYDVARRMDLKGFTLELTPDQKTLPQSHIGDIAEIDAIRANYPNAPIAAIDTRMDGNKVGVFASDVVVRYARALAHRNWSEAARLLSHILDTDVTEAMVEDIATGGWMKLKDFAIKPFFYRLLNEADRLYILARAVVTSA